MKTLANRLGEEVHARLVLLAQLGGVSLTELLRQAVEGFAAEGGSSPEFTAKAEELLRNLDRETRDRTETIQALLQPQAKPAASGAAAPQLATWHRTGGINSALGAASGHGPYDLSDVEIGRFRRTPDVHSRVLPGASTQCRRKMSVDQVRDGRRRRCTRQSAMIDTAASATPALTATVELTRREGAGLRVAKGLPEFVDAGSRSSRTPLQALVNRRSDAAPSPR